MTSWYDIKSLGQVPQDLNEEFLASMFSQPEITDSVNIITNIIQQEAQVLGSSEKCFIGGFSQGCAIAIATYLRFDQGVLGGVFGASGAHKAHIDWSKVNI